MQLREALRILIFVVFKLLGHQLCHVRLKVELSLVHHKLCLLQLLRFFLLCLRWLIYNIFIDLLKRGVLIFRISLGKLFFAPN